MPWLPSTRRLNRTVAALDDVVESIIEQRRRFPGDSDDLLAMLMEARDEETGSAMDDMQLRDEVMTLMLAGHETTSTALSWTLYLLSQHPDTRERLEAEVDAVLGDRTPSIEDVPRLTYANMVLQESMRLYPPAWGLARWCHEADEVGGYYLPPNSSVTLSPFLTHRHPEFWPDAERFDPERFAPEQEKGRPRFAYIPFGGGPRLCIGNQFAMTEAMLILATIVQRYRLDLVPGHQVGIDAQITLRPKGGLPMLVSARH
jgi:cytochrome P450